MALDDGLDGPNEQHPDAGHRRRVYNRTPIVHLRQLWNRRQLLPSVISTTTDSLSPLGSPQTGFQRFLPQIARRRRRPQPQTLPKIAAIDGSREAFFGVVNGTTITAGSVIGSGGNVAPPSLEFPGFTYPRRPVPEKKRHPIRKRGAVAGLTISSGQANGSRYQLDDIDELLLLDLI